MVEDCSENTDEYGVPLGQFADMNEMDDKLSLNWAYTRRYPRGPTALRCRL
jgi:hypothetical protein